MADVQIAVIDQQDTQIALAVPGVQGPPGAAGAAGATGPAGIPVVASGTEAAPAISFVSDPDTGINNNGPNQLALVTGGQNALLVDASGVTAVGGDLTLSDGGTYTTTLQTITPTAARTISFPDATGTVALVGGSSGQLVYNNAGAYAGALGSVVGATGDITLTLNGAASTPPLELTGTWFTGGTATTTKPQVLIEPTGATSTAWSTSGTGLGVNAASGFAGNLLDLQVNGTSRTKVNSTGITLFNSSNAYIDLTGSGNNANSGIKFAGQGGRLTGNADTILSWDFTRVAVIGLGFGPAVAGANISSDIILARDAANTLAQRNGTNAQTFRVYNTYTDASNYERGFLKWNSNVLEIGSEGTGTGSEKPFRITAATLKLPNLPTYADNAAATTGGLVAGDVYKTATGELRITV